MKKVILITGCSSGIGYLTALKFARNEYITYASVRNLNSEGSQNLQTLAAEEKLTLHLLELDVTKQELVTKVINSIKEKEGRIDILINNAGFGSLGPVEQFSIEEVQKQYDTNLFGMLRIVQAVIPIMREQKSGTIINLSSINGLLAFPLFGVYASSKYAIEALTESLRFEVAPFGIKVSIVEPGSFLTDFPKNVKHPAKMTEANSPYKNLTDSFFKKYYEAPAKAQDSFIAKFINPQKVVDTIYSIVQNGNPKLRYIVGIDSKLFLFFKTILPESLWNWILRKVYKW